MSVLMQSHHLIKVIRLALIEVLGILAIEGNAILPVLRSNRQHGAVRSGESECDLGHSFHYESSHTQSRSKVRRSGWPSKYLCNARVKSWLSVATLANRVIDDLNFSTSG